MEIKPQPAAPIFFFLIYVARNGILWLVLICGWIRAVSIWWFFEMELWLAE